MVGKSGKKYLTHGADGRWRIRRGGKYQPLRNERGEWLEPGTAEGDRLYWDIIAGRRQTKGTTFRAAIESYRKSDKYTLKAPRTRADYDRVLAYILEKQGDKDITKLEPADIYRAMDKNKHRVRFANYIPQVLNMVCKEAIRLGWMKMNPATGIDLLAVPKAKQQEHVMWTDAAVQRFREGANDRCRLIFELGVGTVQRPGDLTRFKWSDFDGEALFLGQSKTGTELWLPCTDSLLEVLRTSRPKVERIGQTILTVKGGDPLTYRWMADIMRAERERLGCLAHDLHAMRYRGCHELAEAGCTDEEIAAYSGHMSLAMVQKYAGPARQKMRARQAKEKRR